MMEGTVAVKQLRRCQVQGSSPPVDEPTFDKLHPASVYGAPLLTVYAIVGEQPGE